MASFTPRRPWRTHLHRKSDHLRQETQLALTTAPPPASASAAKRALAGGGATVELHGDANAILSPIDRIVPM